MDRVLNFWFPKRGCAQNNISPNEMRNEMKNDIDENDQYESHDFWFDRTPDQYIKDNFNELIIQAEKGDLDKWTESKDGILALVILLDQFSRNVYRNNNLAEVNPLGNYEKIKINDQKCLPLAQKIIESNKDLEYPLNRRLFFLLVLRHQRKTELLNIVMSRISLYKNEIKNSKGRALLDKFTENTVGNYTNLTDEIMDYTNDDFNNVSINFSDYILDDICQTTYNKMYIDKTINYKNILVKNIIDSYIKNIPNINDRNIGISLSGGVDSMVMAFITKYLIDNKICKSVVAIYLEYINRDEGSDETDYIKRWTKFYNIPLVYRKIHYVKRTSVDRNFYENETKNVRFALYNYAIKKYNLACICLGHHRGDAEENVLMNVFKGRNLLDLSVMHEKCIQDNVIMMRPMINNPKSDIYDFAHYHNIPYMKNTTPDWSCRAVLRDKIMPLMIGQFGEGVGNNLIDIGNQSNEWANTINKLVMEPIFNNIKYGPLGICLPLTDGICELPRVCWLKILMHIFHGMSNKMISGGNLDIFSTWIKKYPAWNKDQHQKQKKDRDEYSTIYFSNNCIGIIKDSNLYIFNEKIKANIPEIDLKIQTNQCNNWQVTISSLEIKQDTRINYTNIINGKYSYTVVLNDNEKLQLINDGSVSKKNKYWNNMRKIFADILQIKKFIPIIIPEECNINSNLNGNKIYLISCEYL
jgi:tRNA(Ile)-lysidine synthetase-like protein